MTIYFFSRHNMISDYTAKIFVSTFSNNTLSVKHEIAEERRVVHHNIIKNKNKHFDHLIIGSSRVMQFGTLTGFQNSLNLGVSGANLTDIKHIYKLTKENNITYDTIIFDFNPWLIIDGSDSRYKQFSNFHKFKYAIYDIFKFNYNLEDIITIFGTLNNYSNSFQVANNNEIKQHSYFIKNTDGSIQQKALSSKDRTTQIQSFSKGLYQMGSFKTINYQMLNETIKLFNEASKKGICLVTLTPFHMEMYEKNKNDIRVKNIFIIEDAFKNSIHNFNIYGSFNHSKINVNETDFLDGFHLKEDAIYKIFNTQTTTSKSNQTH
jgi:hypothetical protein